jgi:hypothetical protein|nr:MAG TPA: hypothetical protein [Caudoviricetes sp.]
MLIGFLEFVLVIYLMFVNLMEFLVLWTMMSESYDRYNESTIIDFCLYVIFRNIIERYFDFTENNIFGICLKLAYFFSSIPSIIIVALVTISFNLVERFIKLGNKK